MGKKKIVINKTKEENLPDHIWIPVDETWGEPKPLVGNVNSIKDIKNIKSKYVKVDMGNNIHTLIKYE